MYGADVGRIVIPKWLIEKPEAGKHAFSLCTEIASEVAEAPGDPRQLVGPCVPAGRVAWQVKDFKDFSADGLSSDVFLGRAIRGDPLKPQITLLDDWDKETNAEKELVVPLKHGDTYTPLYNLKVPLGVDGLVIRGAEFGTIDNNIFVPIPPGLIAHHEPDRAPTHSTRVYDIAIDELSPTAWAGLHSMMWVKELPASGIAQTALKDYALAWNCTTSGGREGNFRADYNESGDSATGWGLATFKSKGGPRGQQPPQPQVEYHVEQTSGREKSSEGRIGRAGGSVAPPPPVPRPIGHTVVPKPQTLVNLNAWMSQERKGPLCGGHPSQDKHLYGFNGAGEAYNSGHLHIDSYFTDEGEIFDAPLDFETAFHPSCTEGVIPYQVHLMYDPAVKHPWQVGQKDGRWRWHVKLPVHVVRPPLDWVPPYEPGDPPPPPGLDWIPPHKYETLEHYLPSLDWVPDPVPIPTPSPVTGGNRDSRGVPLDKGNQSGGGHTPGGYSAGEQTYLDTGSRLSDWKLSPRVAHTFTTGKRESGTALRSGGSGTNAFPFVYKHRPHGNLGDNIEGWICGTADGVVWYAPPELSTRRVRHNDDQPYSLSQSSVGLYGQTILGFGKAATDWGSIVDGFLFQRSADGLTLNVTAVDTAGATDATRTIVFNTPVNLGGGGIFPNGSAAAPSVAIGNAAKGFFNDGAGNLGVSTAGVQRLLIGAAGAVFDTALYSNGDTYLGSSAIDIIEANGVFATDLTASAAAYSIGNSSFMWGNGYFAQRVHAGDGSVGTNGFAFNAAGGFNTGMFSSDSELGLAIAVAGQTLLSMTNIGLVSMPNVLLSRFTVPDGSASIPGLGFTGDGNNGIYRSATDTWHLTAGGTARITIVGTASPSVTIAPACTMSSTLAVTGNYTGDGNHTFGNATSDTLTFTGRLVSDFIPSTANTRDLGTSALPFAEGYINMVRTASGSAAACAVQVGAVGKGFYNAGSGVLGIACNGQDMMSFDEPSQLNNCLKDFQSSAMLSLGASEILTISAGAVTATKSNQTVAAESGTADDLVTITPTNASHVDGTLMVLKADSGDTIQVLETGNISLNGTCELTGDSRLTLIYDSSVSKWVEIARTIN